MTESLLLNLQNAPGCLTTVTFAVWKYVIFHTDEWNFHVKIDRSGSEVVAGKTESAAASGETPFSRRKVPPSRSPIR